MIVLTHPQHGVKHAYLEAEAEADEKNGWTRVRDLEEANPAMRDPVERSESEQQELSPEQRYAIKFGKPPHHRMKQATIEAALME